MALPGKPVNMPAYPSRLVASKVVYPLNEILLLCLWGAISGCESFVNIVEYGQEKLKFLRRLSDFSGGIPSHDTLWSLLNGLQN